MDIKLEWDNEPPSGVADKVIAALQRQIHGLDCPENLIMSLVKLTGDWNGPSVHVYGVAGSDAFHCLYCPTTTWVDFDGNAVDLPPRAPRGEPE